MADTATAAIESLQKDNAEMRATLEQTNKNLEEIIKSHKPPADRSPGGSVLSSEPFSFGRLFKALHYFKKEGPNRGYEQYAKNELALTRQIQKQTNEINSGIGGTVSVSEFCSPYATDLMCVDFKAEGANHGERIPGYERELVKECKQHFSSWTPLDLEEAKRLGCDVSRIQKDQRLDDATLGGVLSPGPSRGELIELLRPSLLFGQAPGIRFVPLGTSGSIEYPRHTGSTTVSATSEGVPTPKSSLTTGMLRMDAKQYSGMAKYTEQMMKFAGNPMIESFLRMDMTQSAREEIDLDMLIGQGGLRILGIVNIPNRLTYTAATVGTDGNTLGTSDPSGMVTAIEMANVPGQVYLAVVPTLWHAITNRKDAVGQYVFQWASANGTQPMSLHGNPALKATIIPVNRRKGAATNLTFLIAFVPAQLMIGQAGVVDFAVTNSHEDDFARGISAIRMTTYIDLGARHPQAINLCDTLIVQ